MLAAFKSVTTLNFKSIHFIGYEDQADLRKNVTLMFENVQLCEKADIKGKKRRQLRNFGSLRGTLFVDTELNKCTMK